MYTFVYICAYLSLRNDTTSSSDLIAPNGRFISESLIEKDVNWSTDIIMSII